jgi:hypothetical protein
MSSSGPRRCRRRFDTAAALICCCAGIFVDISLREFLEMRATEHHRDGGLKSPCLFLSSLSKDQGRLL